MAFTRKDQDRDGGRREHNKTRPGAPFKSAPDEHLVIINDWVLDFIFEDRIPNFLRPLFIDKLGRMAPHEDNRVLAGEFLFQKLEVGQHVQAVDAAVGPKIDEDKLAAEVPLNGQRLRIEPNVILREFLGLNQALLLQG